MIFCIILLTKLHYSSFKISGEFSIQSLETIAIKLPKSITWFKVFRKNFGYSSLFWCSSLWMGTHAPIDVWIIGIFITWNNLAIAKKIDMQLKQIKSYQNSMLGVYILLHWKWFSFKLNTLVIVNRLLFGDDSVLGYRQSEHMRWHIGHS